MLGLGVLDVVIGLVFIYLLYSLLATIIQEIIATYFSLRAKNLEAALTRMLEDGSDKTNIVKAFYDHPLIKFLGEDEKNNKKPAYIKAETFSKVMLDLLKGNQQDVLKIGVDAQPFINNSITTGKIAWQVISKESPELRQIESETHLYLQSIWADAQGDVDKFRAKLENWFDETMARASGWYKKRTQKILFIIGFCIAAFFNVNTIDIATKLEKDPALRAQLVTAADAFVKAHPNLDSELAAMHAQNTKTVVNDSSLKDKENKSKTLMKMNMQADSIINAEKIKRDSLLNAAGDMINRDISHINHLLSLGWEKVANKNVKVDVPFVVFSIIGWFLTALAISLGAPFWFDLLNKLMQLRTSVAPESDAQTKEKKSSAINRKG